MIKLLYQYIVQIYLSYIAKTYGIFIIFFTFILSFDELRRIKSSFTVIVIIKLVLFKLPSLLIQFFVPIVAISYLWLIYHLIATNQLIAIMSNGLLSWIRFIFILSIVSIIGGTFIISFIQPIGAKFLSNRKLLKNQILGRHQDGFLDKNISTYEIIDDKIQIIAAKNFDMINSKLHDVLLVKTSFENIDDTIVSSSNIATLDRKKIIFNALKQESYETDLSNKSIIRNAVPPEEQSVWELIKINNKKSFSLGVKLFFQPLLLITMISLISCFYHCAKVDNKKILLIGTIFTIISYLILTNIILFLSYVINIYIAILLPSVLCILICCFILDYKL